MSVGGKIWVGIIGLGIAMIGAIIMGFGQLQSGETVFNLVPFGIVIVCLGAAVMALSFAFIAIKMWKLEKAQGSWRKDYVPVKEYAGQDEGK